MGIQSRHFSSFLPGYSISSKMTSAEELSVQPRGEAAAHSADSSSAAGISDDMVRLPVSASNYVPSRIERWLQSVVMDKHGRMLLTASNLTGRFWTGSMWYYGAGATGPFTNDRICGVSKDCELVKKCVTGVELDDGVGDAVLFGDCGDEDTMKANVLVACDNGSLDQLKLTSSTEEGEETSDKPFHFFDRVSTYTEHRDSITGVAKSPSESSLVTCSMDSSIVAWDLKTMGVTAHYPRAHGDQALDVSFVDDSNFASCSQDGLVALWDIREKGTKGVIREDHDAFPTCVESSSDNFLIVGDVAGGVHLVDVRKRAKEPVASVSRPLSGHRIHRIVVNLRHQKTPVRFAVCRDSTAVRVFDVEDNSKFIQRYEDFRHTDFVRGLAWGAGDALWSCGWDMQVLRHQVA